MGPSQTQGTQTPSLKRNAIAKEEPSTMQIKMVVASVKEIEEWQKKLKIKNICQQYSQLLLPKEYSFQEKGLCGSTGNLKIIYDNYSSNLKQQIKSRRQENQYYSESQLWFLLYTLCLSTTQFHPHEKLGDIRPQNILVNNLGQIRIKNILSSPKQQTNFDLTLYQNTPTYLSPEELKNYQMKQSINQHLPESTESFSIGLTMLNAAILFDFEKCYNLNNFTFDQYLLKKKLGELISLSFQSKEINQTLTYSNNLKGIIRGLCNINPTQRLSCIKIYQFLRFYQENILKFQQFKLTQQSLQTLFPHEYKYPQYYDYNHQKNQQISTPPIKDRHTRRTIPPNNDEYIKTNQFTNKLEVIPQAKETQKNSYITYSITPNLQSNTNSNPFLLKRQPQQKYTPVIYESPKPQTPTPIVQNPPFRSNSSVLVGGINYSQKSNNEFNKQQTTYNINKPYNTNENIQNKQIYQQSNKFTLPINKPKVLFNTQNNSNVPSIQTIPYSSTSNITSNPTFTVPTNTSAITYNLPNTFTNTYTTPTYNPNTSFTYNPNTSSTYNPNTSPTYTQPNTYKTPNTYPNTYTSTLGNITKNNYTTQYRQQKPFNTDIQISNNITESITKFDNSYKKELKQRPISSYDYQNKQFQPFQNRKRFESSYTNEIKSKQQQSIENKQKNPINSINITTSTYQFDPITFKQKTNNDNKYDFTNYDQNITSYSPNRNIGFASPINTQNTPTTNIAFNQKEINFKGKDQSLLKSIDEKLRNSRKNY